MSNKKEFSILGFGEVMLRLSPVGQERIAMGNQFIKHAGGSELNVVSGISKMGLRAGLITKIPASPIGKYARNTIRSYGVSDDYALDDVNPMSRLGVYYYEGGAYPRKPQVTYDRANSSFTTICPDDIPDAIFEKTELFHTSGISLALSDSPRETAIYLIRKFKEAGAKISFDVNYRASLWSEEKARETINEILPHVDILFVSEETSRRMFQKKGELEDIQKQYCDEYGVSMVASTKRIINSPRSHTFSSMIYSAKDNYNYAEPPYENIEVADRIGSGDAYVSGVLYGILSGKEYPDILSFGNAMSSLKNTVPGDLLATDQQEILGIIKEHRSGSTSEMNR